MKRYGFYWGLFLLITVNIVVLAKIGYNRSGTADAVVELTERELPLNSLGRENSGVSFRIDWRQYDGHEMKWFDKDKLAAIGFDCGIPVEARDAERRYIRALPRQTFVVLEYEGKAWQAWQAQQMKKLGEMEAKIISGETAPRDLAKAKKRYAWELVAASRLFSIDVGNDPELLRKTYPDRTRFIITPARVRLRYICAVKENNRLVEPPVLRGIVEDILTDEVQAPRDKQGLLRSLEMNDGHLRPIVYSEDTNTRPKPPRYRVVLNFGQRYEPWVAAVRPY